MLFSVVIPGIYIWILVRNLDNLDSNEIKQMFGTLYLDLALDEDDSEEPGKQNHHIYI